jgi:DNA-binding response OmpR family regulator
VHYIFPRGADAEALKGAVDTAPLLHKPFRPAELAAAVRSKLDARPAGEIARMKLALEPSTSKIQTTST